MVAYKGTDIRQLDTLHWILDSGLVKDFRVAVDGGANVGEWSCVMARRFGTVHAFEPGGMFKCKAPNVVLHEAALLDEPCSVTINKKGSSRGWHVSPDKSGEIRAVMLDSLRLKSCGFLKLDLEGAEGLALLGASKTLRRFKPPLVVEFGKMNRKRHGLPEERTQAILRDYGYRLIRRIEVDHIYGV